MRLFSLVVAQRYGGFSQRFRLVVWHGLVLGVWVSTGFVKSRPERFRLVVWQALVLDLETATCRSAASVVTVSSIAACFSSRDSHQWFRLVVWQQALVLETATCRSAAAAATV